MKLNQPIGNAMYAPIFIRFALGGYFILAGLLKLENPTAFIQQVQHFQLLKEPLATLYGILLPYAELGAGALLILGLWTTLAGALSSLMLISFIIAMKLFPDASTHLFNKDVLLLCASLSLLWSGPGFYSIDYFRKTGA